MKIFAEKLNLAAKIVNYTIQHPEVQNLLNSEKKFDLVISELAVNEAVFGENF